VLTEIDHARALKQLGLALSVDEAFGRLPPCAPPPQIWKVGLERRGD
jgi:hypothetical protein